MPANFDVVPVLIAALAAFAVGGAWYSPALFANAWMAGHGYSPEKMAAMRATNPPARTMGMTLVCQLIMAGTLELLMSWLRISGVKPGIGFAVLIWFGLVATVTMIANVFSDKPMRVYLIDSGYQLVALVIMGGVLGGWR
jgi:sterol desaturase/sphingolipid hydroxylase (fatty acid hydroxylase superfamily)